MRRFLLIVLIGLFTLLQAEDQVQIFATHMQSKEQIVEAEEDVLVLYQDYYLSAKRARYDRESGVIELFGDVTVMKGAVYHMIGKYVRFEIPKDRRRIEPFYLLEKESQVWMSCASAASEQDAIELSSGMLSGCDPNDPIWKLYFSSSDYNSTTKWLNLYNTRVVIGEVPVFYLPYFGYSLDTTRRTGLLLPSMGFSEREGFFYEQPIYIAEQNWWDLELNPQIRTSRGYGLYSMFRFVDTNLSSGSLYMGTFKEKTEYFNEYNLENTDHYGVNFKYTNQNPLRTWLGMESEGQSGIYADINWMNDIEYINLKNNDETLNATSSQIFSKANLFYNGDQNYFGTYFKYYLDLKQENNDETIQNLPILHYHRYLESWLEDHLFYTVDLTANNYYRKVGSTAQEIAGNIPLTLQGTFFDGYLDVSLGTQLYGKTIRFDDSAGSYDSGRFGRSTNYFKVGTMLTRGYDALIHVAGLDVSFVKNGAESRSGYFEERQLWCELYPDSDECSYYNITDIEESTQIRFHQYLYDYNGSQVLYHQLTQSIDGNDKLQDLENELEWQPWPAVTLYSDTIYNHDIGTIVKQSTTLSYNGERFDAGIGHLYEDKRRHNRATDSSYLTMDFSYKPDDHYRYFARFAYDIEKSMKKKLQAGFLYSKRCWDFGIRYVELNRPVLQSGGVASSIYDKYIYVTIILKPMGGSEFKYELNDLLGGDE